MIQGTITESQFNMWRTLFALAHADHKVTEEELRFMTEAMEDIPFSEEQHDVLREDIKTPQDIVEMFGHISETKDQAAFFRFARDLVWIDGEYGAEEQDVMLQLKRLHLKNVNVDELVGNVEIELEGEDSGKTVPWEPSRKAEPEKRTRKILFSFRERFIKDTLSD